MAAYGLTDEQVSIICQCLGNVVTALSVEWTYTAEWAMYYRPTYPTS